jgi:exonuclease 3'-5' domain-containing protein 1
MSPSKYKEEAEVELVDDADGIHECLEDLYPGGKPRSGSIAIDLEGVNLGRKGKLSIMQVYASKSKKIWIVDVTTLGKTAFDEKDEHSHNLRGMLEDKDIKKVTLLYLTIILV